MVSPVVAAFVFGFLVGYLILRLGGKKELAAWEREVRRPLGWVVMGASFAMAVALLAWRLFEGGSG